MFQGFGELSRGQQFRRLVQPRSDWFDMQAIERGLVQILPEFDRLEIALPKINELMGICSGNAVNELVHIVHSEKGIKGLKGEFPQHAGIIYLGHQESAAPALCQLAALVMACIDDWGSRVEANGREESDVALLTRRIETIWRQIRLISDSGMKVLPPVSVDVERFHDALEETLDDLDPRDAEALGQDREYLDEILRFFNFYLGGGRIYTSSRKRGESALEVEPHVVTVTADVQDPDTDLEACIASDLIIVNRRNDKQVRQSDHYRAGNAPDEIEDGPRLIQSVKPISFQHGGSPAQAAVRLVYRKVHQRRSAQLLPGRWNTLTDAELRLLLAKILSRTCELKLHVKFAVLLSFLAGRDLESALATSVVKTRGQLPRAITSVAHVFLVAETQEWCVKIQGPEFRRKVKNEWETVLQEHEPSICLPIPPIFWEALSTLVVARAAKAKKRSVKLFTDLNEAKVNEQARGFLISLNHENKGRLTLSRVAYQLTQDLQSQSGDLIEALLITGRQPPFGATAALYYHHCDRQTLVDHYLQVTKRWQDLVPPEIPAAQQHQKQLFDGAVGSDLVIETRTVSDMLRALRGQTEHDRALLGTLEGLRYFHNSLTNYAIMMTFWLTGYRAVQDPVADESDYNTKRRMMVIADKTGDCYGHSRMVPVCRILAEQLNVYRAHTKWLKKRLSLANRQIRDTMFFYVDGDLNELQVRPASMKELLEWAYVLPLNLNRHWIRGELRRQKVPGPYVDRFMGHWGIGQEPWARHSTVDPIDFHEVVDGALERLSHELELCVVKGASNVG